MWHAAFHFIFALVSDAPFPKLDIGGGVNWRLVFRK